MKYFILLFSLLFHTASFAERIVDMPVPCYSATDIAKTTKQFDEVIVAMATSVRLLQDGSAVFIPMLIFANPETGSYTIVEQHEGKEPYCVISAGRSYKDRTVKAPI